MMKRVLHCFIAAFALTAFGAQATDVSQFFGGGLMQPARFFTTSQNVAIPVSGTYRLTLMGAGGSGACFYGLPSASSGGGGGGFVEDDVYIAAGTTLNITLGVGGQSAGCVTAAAGVNGNAGGTSTIIWSGVSLTAGGGSGGVYVTSGTALGGAGGIASGGTNNQIGGTGGAATYSVNSYNAGGGGGPGGPFGPGGAGGASASSASNGCGAGGGGSISGFPGGSAGGFAVLNSAGGGAGTGGAGGAAGASIGAAGVNMMGLTNGASVDGFYRNNSSSTVYFGFDSLFDPWRALTGAVGIAGSASSVTAASQTGYGGASGGIAIVTGGGSSAVTPYFAGTGGGCMLGSTGALTLVGPIYGGGGGGTAGTRANDSSPGGNAIASIERIK